MGENLSAALAIFFLVFTVWFFSGESSRGGCSCGGPNAPANQVLRAVTSTTGR